MDNGQLIGLEVCLLVVDGVMVGREVGLIGSLLVDGLMVGIKVGVMVDP